MSATLRVFLSSTSVDLKPHRTKVREIVERLGHASICMETFGARPTSPLETCKQEVQRADALVVIVGHRYGWIPGAEDEGDGEKSITWWEVQWALEAGKPVYAFLVDPNARWNGEKEQDRLTDAESDEAVAEVARAVRNLKRFRAFLEKKTTLELFTSSENLGGKVATSLHHWLVDERSKIVAATSGDSFGTPPPAAASSSPDWSGSPFPGLRAFTPADARIFFGRDNAPLSDAGPCHSVTIDLREMINTRASVSILGAGPCKSQSGVTAWRCGFPPPWSKRWNSKKAIRSRFGSRRIGNSK